MSEAFGWISDLVGWIVNWVPRLLLVRATHKGIKFRHGKKIIPLKPGIHIYWPAVTEVVSMPAVRQTLNLPTQVVQCANGKRLAVSGVVVYSIGDIAKALALSWDVDDTVQDLALTCILRALIGRKVSDLIQHLKSGGMETKMTKDLQKELRKFGVRVQYCALTDCAVANVLHMTGAGGPAVVEEEEEEE
jgi:regulator of protease activity HflC (stomatin/prohibitin superfamily)